MLGGLALPACKTEARGGDCEAAVVRYWRSIDIEPYFSALSLKDAVAACKGMDSDMLRCAAQEPLDRVGACPGVDALPVDRGWKRGLYCYTSDDDGWSRCERSNRECEYYRRVATRDQRKIGRCALADRAWAIIYHDDPVDPQPTAAECTRVRQQLLKSGRIDDSSPCKEVSYEELIRGRRRFIPSPSTR